MIGSILQIISIPADAKRGILQHAVQGVDIRDDDISRILFYEGHDVIVGSPFYEHPQIYCLKIYQGKKPNIPLDSQYLKDYDDKQLLDLSERSNGKLPIRKLIVVRDIVRELTQQIQINRIEPRCIQCMRLDFGISTGQIKP